MNSTRTAPISQVEVESELVRLIGEIEQETEAFEILCKDPSGRFSEQGLYLLS